MTDLHWPGRPEAQSIEVGFGVRLSPAETSPPRRGPSQGHGHTANQLLPRCIELPGFRSARKSLKGLSSEEVSIPLVVGAGGMGQSIQDLPALKDALLHQPHQHFRHRIAQGHKRCPRCQRDIWCEKLDHLLTKEGLAHKARVAAVVLAAVENGLNSIRPSALDSCRVDRIALRHPLKSLTSLPLRSSRARTVQHRPGPGLLSLAYWLSATHLDRKLPIHRAPS